MDSRRQINRSLIAIGIVLPVAIFIYVSYLLIGTFAKANIRVDARTSMGPMKNTWRAIAQGGEQSGTRMLQPVTTQLRSLFPRYIRIDHLYDFYNIVSKSSGGITFEWTKLDETVCDIYASGARPFFSLGYMPGAISQDGSVISTPNNWDDWKYVVQKTIERYSGKNTVLCGGTIRGDSMNDLYYEVWNEPDLEHFGKWSIYGGNKSYPFLYQQTVQGAQSAQNVYNFHIGGPSTTAPYKNWFTGFFDYAAQNNLRVDFLSWHRYSKDPNQFSNDMKDIDNWLSDDKYDKYVNLPRIITEWGYDPAYNPAADGPTGAAHLVASMRNMLDRDIQLAFTFEAKDGDNPSHGILTKDGVPRSRFQALHLLDPLDGERLWVDGESNYVKAIGSRKDNIIRVLITNYDSAGQHGELVPISFSGLEPGTYNLSVTNIGYSKLNLGNITVNGEDISRSLYMSPNHVALIELARL